jgi:hypothetical protein
MMNYYVRYPAFMVQSGRKFLTIWIICYVGFSSFESYAVPVGLPQEAKVHQKKIDKERAKKEKEGQKQYDKAVKKHMDNQSKETKKMMKQAKKDAKKNTPLK